jgi:membrane protein
MSQRLSLQAFLREVSKIWVTKRPNTLAAALAYFGIFSIAPLIFIALTVANIFLDQLVLTDLFYEQMEAVFGPGASQWIQDAVLSISQTIGGGSIIASLISVIALLLAASGLFFQLQFALNMIWNVPPPEKGATLSFIRQRLFSFLMVIGVGLLLVIFTGANLIFSWFGSLLHISAFVPVINLVGFIAMVTVLFAMLYKLLPEVPIAWRDVWLGAFLAALLVSIGLFLISFYLSSGLVGSAFEAAGAVAVILIGFYYGAQIFLFGAVCTRVVAERSRQSPVSQE